MVSDTVLNWVFFVAVVCAFVGATGLIYETIIRLIGLDGGDHDPIPNGWKFHQMKRKEGRKGA